MNRNERIINSCAPTPQDLSASSSHFIQLGRQLRILRLNKFMAALDFSFKDRSCATARATQLFHLSEQVAESVDQLVTTVFPFVDRHARQVGLSVLLRQFEELEYRIVGGVVVGYKAGVWG